MVEGTSEQPWSPAVNNAINCLQVVYKIAERCNLNCSYCYYYNMGDKTALERPARASQSTSDSLANWLAAGVEELGIREVHISFHGGEPMLLRAEEFARTCEIFKSALNHVAKLRFSIQTNGTLLNDGWLEALTHYQVSVGVSIDGSKVDHDRYRLDHQGNSSFNKTELAIERLVSASRTYPTLSPGTISVLDQNVDYRKTYQYLRSLGIETMHFLLPDRNRDDWSKEVDEEASVIGAGLLALFNEWLLEDNPSITVRFIKDTLENFQIGNSLERQPNRRKNNQIIVARSDNTVAIDDSLIPALQWYSATPEFSINNFSLKEVFSDSIFEIMEHEESRIPDACRGCTWEKICRGGDLENRYSSRSGFNNRSVYCETYKKLYKGICKTLASNGYPEEEIINRFGDLERV